MDCKHTYCTRDKNIGFQNIKIKVRDKTKLYYIFLISRLRCISHIFLAVYIVYTLYIQCFPLKCLPQHGGWRGQPLIAQVATGKSKAIPQLHGSLQLSKITKKNNHVPYNVRCWKCLSSFIHSFLAFFQEMCIYMD